MIVTLFLAVVVILFFFILLIKGIRTVPQANVAVVTRFGKYRKILTPGLHVVNPFTNKVAITIPVQNRTAQLQFSAITEDQAAVHFTATIIYTVASADEQNIMLVAFKFIDGNSFTTALNSAVEASVREFVASKKQAEVLGLRQAIVDHAKTTLDEQLASWGYLLVDLTVNDIAFDPEVMKSMSRVVSAKNAQTAAEYEGQALLIARTKQAEAEGKALVIAASNGAEAARLRGEGIAAQRTAIAEGLSESGLKLAEAGIDISILGFSMWTETLRDITTHGAGNTIFLDGGIDSMEDALRRTNGFLVNSKPNPELLGTLEARRKAEASAAATTTTAASMGAGANLSAKAERAAAKVEQGLTSAVSGGPEGVTARLAELRADVAEASQAARDISAEVTGTIQEVTGQAKAAVAKVLPPAGFYPDPQSGRQRWWDGAAWTSTFQ